MPASRNFSCREFLIADNDFTATNFATKHQKPLDCAFVRFDLLGLQASVWIERRRPGNETELNHEAACKSHSRQGR